MRILLISDLHANAAALAAIDEPHDACLCLGDLVEYGPDPAETVEWVKANCLAAVRGNHDHGAAQNVEITGAGGFRYLTQATRPGTINALNPCQRRYLATLPTIKQLTLNDKRFLLVHASPRDPLDEYVPADPQAWTARLHGWEADYVCVGHTHMAFTLDLGKTKVINPGSVGLQRDGNPKVRYAVIEPDGEVKLKQIDYDIDRVVDAVMRSPYEDRARQMLVDVYRGGKVLHFTGGLMNGHAPGLKAIA